MSNISLTFSLNPSFEFLTNVSLKPKKSNVKSLLESIINKFNTKEDIEFDISVCNQPISPMVRDFLKKEFSKLRFSTKIGFIYAYHDPEYPGKFFLIDGQQRITTLYLLLLALYKRQPEKHDIFRELYFNNSQPKLDYRVREITHDYLVSLIENEISTSNSKFVESNKYYDYLYTSDLTTRTITDNYELIEQIIDKDINKENIPLFTQYIEHFVEFNFFDTNISSQGERLYLYMNSRGESLSFQENIKSILFRKCANEEKETFGHRWEEWQDFYWNHRGNNPNADKGFQEFIKWAVILHICSTENVKLKPSRELENGKRQTKSQIIEDYIRVEQKREKAIIQFEDYIKNYIKENSSFDFIWLQDVQYAIKMLYKLYIKAKDKKGNRLFSNIISENWLSEMSNTINYLPLLSILRYLMRFRSASMLFRSASVADVLRLGVYMKNKSYEDNRSKNPDTATIDAIYMVNNIPNSSDFIQKDDYRICSDIDKEIFDKLRIANDRNDWEKALYEFVFISDGNIAKFLDGNPYCIWKCSTSPEDFKRTLSLFLDKIYNHRHSKELRQELLRYGDYYVDENGGSSNLTAEWFDRYNWLSSTTDWRIRLTDNAFIENILKPYLNNSTPTANIDDKWYKSFLDEDFGIDLFIGDFKFLYHENSGRIILLQGKQAGEFKSFDLEILMFKKLYNKLTGNNAKIWIYNYM